MDALDGNAIGGLMLEIFGVEMTTYTGVCAGCGAVAVMAELAVYLEAPGTVSRCRSCDSVLMVVVDKRGTKCVDLRGMARMDPAA